MDLIVADASGSDIGVVKCFSCDLAYGTDENDFELKMDLSDDLYEADYRIYAEGTEYGGIIDDVSIDTSAETVTYHGRTWHGILDSKIICPDSGADYYTATGKPRTIVNTVISRIGLSSLFTVEASALGTSQTYQFDRYCTAYVGGLLKFLESINYKMVMKYASGVVNVSVVPLSAYADTDSFDADRINFKICQVKNKINHLICLGQGDLAARQVINLYADADGNISQTQTYTGLDEVAEVYDYSSVESEADLLSYGIDEFSKRRAVDTIDASLSAEENFDIGDLVTQTERHSGITVSKKISKKIVTIDDEDVSIDYEIGGF